MFRPGTNQQAVFEWLSSFSSGEERMFDVPDRLRGKGEINNVMARVYISAQSKIMGKRFKTKTKPGKEGKPRMHVTRIE